MTVDVATLGLDVDTRKLKAAERDQDSFARSAGDMERKTGKATDSIGKGFGVMAAAAAVATAAMVAGFVAVRAAALKGARDIDEAAKAARRLGASVGGFRAAQLAAGEMGVSASALTNDLQTMNRELERGSDGAKRAMQALGVTVAQLSGLDADQKLALIADRVEDLGLNADQASVLMQDLGIRNREMVLAVMSGGGAFRRARTDIDDYGLAISKVDSAAIEKANDQLGRLGLISQYAGQQLAIALVPALGRMAEAMTDSLRAGGMLRAVIDGLVNNIDILSAAVAAAVTVMAGRYVAALVAANAATVSFTGVLAIARGAVAALLGPVGLLYIAIGAGAAAWIAHRAATNDSATAMNSAESAAKDLSIELTAMAGTDLPNASKATVQLANDNLKLASSAYEAARAQVELAKATQQAAFTQMATEDAFNPGVVNPGRAALEAANAGLMASVEALKAAEEELNNRVFEGNQVKTEAAEVVERLRGEVSDLEGEVSGLGGAASKTAGEIAKTTDEIEVMEKALDGNLTKAIDGVANAWGDFVMRGFKDFQGFARGVLDTFKNMLRDMIVMAARNKIMLSMGMGGGGGMGGMLQAGTSMMGGGGGMMGGGASMLGGGAGGGGMLAGVGGMAGLGSAFMGGAGFFTSGVSAGFAAGGIGGAISGGGTAMATALSGATGGLGGLAAAAGAVALPLLAVAVVFMALQKKTKTLAEGIDVTIKGFGTAVKTFETIETSRFFGLSKKTNTKTGTADAATADPIREAVDGIQGAIVEAAEAFGFGADSFSAFSFQFRADLKGLSAEDASKKINDELTRMGDAMAGMLPHFKDMNELLEAHSQRIQLEDRLLQLQGKSAELLIRQREREMAATHVLNQGLLTMIHALEDAAIAMQGLVDGANDDISRQIALSRRFADQARRSAEAYRSAADSMRNAASGIGPRSIAELSASFASLLARSLGGDLDAMNALGGAGADLATASQGQVGSALELARIEAGIRNQLSQAAAVADITATGADYQAKLFDVQTSALEYLQDMLRQGNATQDMLAEQIKALNRINTMIADSSDMQVRTALNAAGQVTAGLFDNGGRLVAGLSSETARQIAAIASQNMVITNQTTGQTAAINAAQRLTTGEVDKVGKLQGETISVTELVERATNNNAAFTRALLDRLSEGIPLTDINVLVSGNNQIVSRLTTISNLLGEQANERKRAEEIGKLQSQLAAASQAKEMASGGVSQAISAIKALEKRTGARIENAQGGAATLQQRADGTAEFNGAWVMGTSAAHAAFRAQFWNAGGLQDQMIKSDRAVKQATREMESQRDAIRALGGVPAFAKGGMHTGGLRLVGENGPELEVTGPSRIYSASQTANMMSGKSDNADIIKELKELKMVLADMKDEQRQLAVNRGADLRRVRLLEERREAEAQ